MTAGTLNRSVDDPPLSPLVGETVKLSPAQQGLAELVTELKRLSEQHLLASTDQKRQRLLVRKTLEGRRREVLHLRAKVLLTK